jgi:hypothetical protein
MPELTSLYLDMDVAVGQFITPPPPETKIVDLEIYFGDPTEEEDVWADSNFKDQSVLDLIKSCPRTKRLVIQFSSGDIAIQQHYRGLIGPILEGMRELRDLCWLNPAFAFNEAVRTPLPTLTNIVLSNYDSEDAVSHLVSKYKTRN